MRLLKQGLHLTRLGGLLTILNIERATSENLPVVPGGLSLVPEQKKKSV
jgi:hypothetical protein